MSPVISFVPRMLLKIGKEIVFHLEYFRSILSH